MSESQTVKFVSGILEHNQSTTIGTLCVLPYTLRELS